MLADLGAFHDTKILDNFVGVLFIISRAAVLGSIMRLPQYA